MTRSRRRYAKVEDPARRCPIAFVYISGHLNIHGTKANCFGSGSASRCSWLSGIGYRGRGHIASSSQCDGGGSDGGSGLDNWETLSGGKKPSAREMPSNSC